MEGRDAGALMYTGADIDGRLEFSTAGMSINAGTFATWGYLSDPQPETDGRYFFGHTSQPQFSNRIQLYLQEGTTPSRLLDVGLGGSHTTRTDIVELPMEEWLHVAMTWDNGAYGVYYNGEQVANGSYSGLTGPHRGQCRQRWKQSASYEAFGGMLDDARIYNRALTAAEVSTIFRMPPVSLFLGARPQSGRWDGGGACRRGSCLDRQPVRREAHDVYWNIVRRRQRRRTSQSDGCPGEPGPGRDDACRRPPSNSARPTTGESTRSTRRRTTPSSRARSGASPPSCLPIRFRG